jgi:hypothetical protein
LPTLDAKHSTQFRDISEYLDRFATNR